MTEQNKGKNKGWANLIPAKPGECRNPGGRPKSKPVSDMYREIMSDPANLKKFCEAQFAAACNGDTSAAKDIIDRLEGKPLQSMDINDNRRTDGANRLAELFEGAIKFNSSETGSGRPQ